jgi:hypothetical protein
MPSSPDVLEYQQKLDDEDAAIGQAIAKLISKDLPAAEGKVWHGHPVWFLEGNPVVGYSLKKSGIEVLFWSGQSFKTAGLKPIGKFKAAAYAVETLKSLDKALLSTWLKEAQAIQWDYANLIKKKKLEKLTKF